MPFAAMQEPTTQRPLVPRSAASRVRHSLLAFAIAWATYNANLRTIATGDSLPARFLPFAILQGTVRLDPVYEAARMGHPDPYWIMRDRQGRSVSMYPLVTPLLATPLYLPAFALWTLHGRKEHALLVLGEWMEKLAASAIAAAAVALFHLLIAVRLDAARSILLTLAFMLGTSTWATSSQALWQHGTGELLLIGGLLAATGVPSTRTSIAAGVLCGLAAANRPPDVVLAAGIGGFIAFTWPLRFTGLTAVAACAALAPSLAYNWTAFHVLGGGYALALGTFQGGGGAFFHASPVTTGIAGLLVSPGKGLLVYCPFLLFLVRLPWSRFELPAERRLAICLAVAVAAQVALYARTDWRGGASYGPRFLTDATPFLLFLLVPALRSLQRRGLAPFAVLVGVSIALQAVGVFYYPSGGSDFGRDPWKASDAAFLVEAAAGRAPMPLLESLRAEIGARAAR